MARAEIEFRDERIVGEARGCTFVAQLSFDKDDGAVSNGERRLHVLFDQHDGDAVRVDLLQTSEDFRDYFRR